MRTYLTLLSTVNYLSGVLGLYRSLLAVDSKYPLCCLLSCVIEKDVEDRLVHEGISCIRLSGHSINSSVNPDNDRFSNWNYSFDKLRIWGLTQYEKIVFLDSDMLILKNLDHLFDCEAFSGVIAGQSFPGHENWQDINSGLMVIIPDKKIESELLSLMPKVVESYRANGRLVGDQDVLHNYLADDWRNNKNLHLDEGYNIFADCLTYYINNLGYSFDGQEGKPISVVHFIGKYKPWMRPSTKDLFWLLKMRIRNPYYFKAFRKFRSYL